MHRFVDYVARVNRDALVITFADAGEMDVRGHACLLDDSVVGRRYDVMVDDEGYVMSMADVTNLKLRDGDQPLSTVNDRQDVQSMVIADIKKRRQVGIERYGTALQPFNGRDALRDAYEEAIDLAMYLKQAIVERDHGDSGGAAYA